jgi:pimeloyl-ACP methyl ester carboxylesterase
VGAGGAGLEWIGLPYWAIRERFQAVTGIGLAAAEGAVLPTRYTGEAGDPGAPTVSFLASGSATARRIVFVHGTPGDGGDWAPFLRDVPEGQYRIAVDRPGFGESGPGAPVAGRYDIRFASIERLRQGEAFGIIEINGAGGEATMSGIPRRR